MQEKMYTEEDKNEPKHLCFNHPPLVLPMGIN